MRKGQGQIDIDFDKPYPQLFSNKSRHVRTGMANFLAVNNDTEVIQDTVNFVILVKCGNNGSDIMDGIELVGSPGVPYFSKVFPGISRSAGCIKNRPANSVSPA